jgi:hypothetical protein
MNDAALQASLPAADATKFAKEDAVAMFYDEHGSGTWKPCCLLARAKGYNRYQIEWQDTRRLMGEVTSEYARCINKIVFDEALKEKDFRNMLEHLELPSRPEKPPAPYLGTVDIPPYSYDSASMQFKDVTYNDLGEVIHAMHNVRAECNKVLDTSMFITDLLKALEVSVIYSISSRPFAIYVSLLSC